MLIFNWMNWSEPEYNGPYPTWGRIIGWLMITSSIIWIPFVMIFEFLRAEGNLADVSNAGASIENVNGGGGLICLSRRAWGSLEGLQKSTRSSKNEFIMIFEYFCAKGNLAYLKSINQYCVGCHCNIFQWRGQHMQLKNYFWLMNLLVSKTKAS